MKTMAKRTMALALCAALAACGGGGGGSGGAAGPNANTGSGSQGSTSPLAASILGGSFTVASAATGSLACSASGGTAPYAFEWSVLDNAGLPIALTGSSTAQASFVAPAVSQETTLAFQCRATDAKGAQSLAKTSVTVSAPSSKLAADAGLAFTAAPGSSNKLRCQASGGVAPYSYQWRILDNAGANLSLSSYSSQDTSFTAPAVGAKTAVSFQCVVIDSANAGATGVVSATIAPSSGGLSLVASAAPGQLVNPGQTVALDGSGSAWFDSSGQKASGAAISYQWASSDPSILITNPTAAQTNFVVPADYVTSASNPSHREVTFTLTASAGSQTSSTATTFSVDPYAPFSVTVLPPSQAFSLAAAPGGVATATMTANANAGSSALFYQWTQVSGPAVSLGGANTASAGFSTSVAGVYNFNVAVGYRPISASNPGIVQSMATVTVAP